MNFDYPVLVVLLALFILLYHYRAHLTEKRNQLLIPSLSLFARRTKTSLERFSKIPQLIFLVGLGSLVVALIDPHRFIEEPSSDLPPREGLAFYLLLDRSGSMGSVVEQIGKGGSWEALTRFNVLQKAATDVVSAFPKDLIGLIAFARAAEVISPLTLDHKLLLKKIKALEVIKDRNQDGTSIGYAIYKTAQLISLSQAFDSNYHILSAFMIIITDGLQDPSILDKGNRLRSMELEEASAYAKEKKIKVFIINIGPEINSAQFAPNKREMERITAATGGKLVVVEQLAELEKILLDIPKEEKNLIAEQGEQATLARASFFPYFIAAGLSLLLLSFVLEQTTWKKAL